MLSLTQQCGAMLLVTLKHQCDSVLTFTNIAVLTCTISAVWPVRARTSVAQCSAAPTQRCGSVLTCTISHIAASMPTGVASSTQQPQSCLSRHSMWLRSCLSRRSVWLPAPKAARITTWSGFSHDHCSLGCGSALLWLWRSAPVLLCLCYAHVVQAVV